MGESKCRFPLGNGGCLLLCYWANWLPSIWLAVYVEYHVDGYVIHLFFCFVWWRFTIGHKKSATVGGGIWKYRRYHIISYHNPKKCNY